MLLFELQVTGKAMMLDEIINYVQSLQRQVEVSRTFLLLLLLLFLLGFAHQFSTLVKFLWQLLKKITSAIVSQQSSISSSKYGIDRDSLWFWFPLLQFLSMKLASVNPRLDFDVENFVAKEVMVSQLVEVLYISE